MNSFYIEEEPYEKEKYYIGVKIVIYRTLLGKYPDFLSFYERNSKDGYTTKFAYLIDEATQLSKNEAKKKCEELECEFSNVLRECENSGDWSKCPFDFSKMDLLWCK